MTRRAGLFHLNEQHVAITVKGNVLDLLHMAAGFALHPKFLAANGSRNASCRWRRSFPAKRGSSTPSSGRDRCLVPDDCGNQSRSNQTSIYRLKLMHIHFTTKTQRHNLNLRYAIYDLRIPSTIRANRVIVYRKSKIKRLLPSSPTCRKLGVWWRNHHIRGNGPWVLVALFSRSMMLCSRYVLRLAYVELVTASSCTRLRHSVRQSF